MAISTGLDAQLGAAEETTFGTFATPTNFIHITKESLKRNAERDESEAIRPGERVLHADDWEEGRTGTDGDVEIEWPDRGMGLIVKHMLGSLVSTQPDDVAAPTVFQHVGSVGALDGKSLSIQVGRPDRGGVVRPFSYSGVKVVEWEISCEVDGFLVATLSTDGQAEDRATALAAKSFLAGVRKLHWAGGSLTVGGVAVPVSSVKLAGSNNLRVDRYFMTATGAKQKDEQLEGDGLREYTGEFDCEWDGADGLYDKFVDGTTAELVAKWEGRVIEDAFKFSLEVRCPVVRFDGETPNVDGPAAIERTVPFKALSNGTDSAVEFTILDNVELP